MKCGVCRHTGNTSRKCPGKDLAANPKTLDPTGNAEVGAVIGRIDVETDDSGRATEISIVVTNFSGGAWVGGLRSSRLP